MQRSGIFFSSTGNIDYLWGKAVDLFPREEVRGTADLSERLICRSTWLVREPNGLWMLRKRKRRGGGWFDLPLRFANSILMKGEILSDTGPPFRIRGIIAGTSGSLLQLPCLGLLPNLLFEASRLNQH